MEDLKNTLVSGTIMTVKDGFLICPRCRNRHVRKIGNDEVARNSIAFCRDCKLEFKIDIEKGQCFESRSR